MAVSSANSPVREPVLFWTAWSAYVVGVIWRAIHIFYAHHPLNSVYSDMAGFKVRAEGIIDRVGQENISDIILPPGGHIMFGYCYWLDRSWNLAVAVQYFGSVLIPLMLAALAYEVYGRRVALVALIMSSLYFPFIHYAAFFLTESPFLLCMLVSFWLLTRSINVRDGKVAFLLSLSGGLVLGLATALKPVVLLPAMFVFACLLLAAMRPRGRWLLLPGIVMVMSILPPPALLWMRQLLEIGGQHFAPLTWLYDLSFVLRPLLFWILLPPVAILSVLAWWRYWPRILLVLATSAVGLTVVIIPLVERATRLNEGRFCFISTNGPVNMLMGHQGRKAMFYFRDPKRPGQNHDFGCPVAFARGYNENVTCNFGAYDGPRLVAESWKWINANPVEALRLSSEHVHEIFYGSIFWPCGAEGTWHGRGEMFHIFFLWLILLPAAIHLVWRWRGLATLRGAGLADVLFALLIVALMVVAFMTEGEPRFRIPFDAFILLLAARFYTLGASRSDTLIPNGAAATRAPPAIDLDRGSQAPPG